MVRLCSTGWPGAVAWVHALASKKRMTTARSPLLSKGCMDLDYAANAKGNSREEGNSRDVDRTRALEFGVRHFHSPLLEEGPTRRSRKCHATLFRAKRGRSYTCPRFSGV